MKKDELEQLKTLELELFSIFLDVCKKHSLRYFLLGGTCLGAVRHKGFIPWDDDIDVGMPRNDYEKFLEVAQNEFPEYVFLQYGKTDPEYPMSFAKIRNSNTTFKEESMSLLKINHGVYIDVFPLDGYVDDKNFEKNFYSNKRIISSVFKPLGKKPIKTKVLNMVYRLLYNYKKIRDKQDLLLQTYSYDDCNIVANYCGAWGKKEIMPKEYFGNGVEGVFEGIPVILPEKYDKYLTQMYGDYMTPPPKDKQVGHHYTSVIDFNKSYKFYE